MSNQAKISVTFYFGPSDEPWDKLTKHYVLNHWADEVGLRRLLDDAAREISYISGYGIGAIKVQSDQFSFTVDYSHQFTAGEQVREFWHALRFEIGRYVDRHGWPIGPVELEIPRVSSSEGNNVFSIRKFRARVRGHGTFDDLVYNRADPVLVSFWQKLKEGTIAVDTKKKWQPADTDYVMISWEELPKTQTSDYRWDKARERKEAAERRERKHQEAEEKKKKKLEKAGIVYKDKKQRAKAHQVYIIAAKGEGFSGVYKIGISNAPGKRLQSLNTSNPFQLEIVHKFVAEPAKEAESRLHAMFAACRVSGEWFRLTDEQLAGLKQIIGFKDGEFTKGIEAH